MILNQLKVQFLNEIIIFFWYISSLNGTFNTLTRTKYKHIKFALFHMGVCTHKNFTSIRQLLTKVLKLNQILIF